MNIIESILSFLKRKDTAEESAPEGFCPNCWGKQEYGGQFYEAIKNENVDINQTSAHKGWIQDYADKHLSGIRLQKKGDGYMCPKCKITYRPS